MWGPWLNTECEKYFCLFKVISFKECITHSHSVMETTFVMGVVTSESNYRMVQAARRVEWKEAMSRRRAAEKEADTQKVNIKAHHAAHHALWGTCLGDVLRKQEDLLEENTQRVHRFAQRQARRQARRQVHLKN